jgi:hypothetical protein
MRIILRSVATFLAEESRAGGGPMQTDFVGKFSASFTCIAWASAVE